MDACSFDFGDGAEFAHGEGVSGIPGEQDNSSHELSKCSGSGMMHGQSILTMQVAQREWLNPNGPVSGQGSIANASTVANIAKLHEELRKHLETIPCLIVHYGAFDGDFESLMLFGRALSKEHNGELPVAFCATGARGRDVIAPEHVAAAILKGISVFYHVLNQQDFNDLGRQLGICAVQAREEKIDISQVRFILVLDKAAGFVLGKIIRDCEDDRTLLVDEDDTHKSQSSKTEKTVESEAKHKVDERFLLSTKYLPQVEALQEIPSTMMNKEWGAKMSMHAFRNAHYPPTAIEKARPPLDQLGFFLAFHPFGMSYVIAISLLPDKGQLVKKLLESWVSTMLGTPIRFIDAM